MISPLGTVALSEGLSMAFTISPDPGYHIADVKVDGVSVGAMASYTFDNVTADRNIATFFAITPQNPNASNCF